MFSLSPPAPRYQSVGAEKIVSSALPDAEKRLYKATNAFDIAHRPEYTG